MHTAHFGSDTTYISSLGPKLWKGSEKIKHASTLSTVKAKVCKIFVNDLGFVELCSSLQWNLH